MCFKKFFPLLLMLLPALISAQNMNVYIKHSSGLLLTYNQSSGKGVIVEPDNSLARQLQLKPHDDGTYAIVYTTDEGKSLFLALNGQWNTIFQEQEDIDEARYSIETLSGGQMILLRCKKNGKYLGTDNTSDGSSVYSDKDGKNEKHRWYLADTPDRLPTAVTYNYIVSVADRRQVNEGWGVSLCWWANMCGKWDDEKIDEIVEWLVSPEGLNNNLFRYNIGGGDDPENRNCTLHHMGKGKGLRAEMEGFKDSSTDSYHWDRDAAQRKIMLKIKEKRPDAIFEAFSNSAPYYMTYSGCVAGAVNGGDDNLRPEYYEEFAHYLVDVCKHYKDEYGIEFKTLEPFNEPNTSYWSANGSQEGCHFGFSSQIVFLKVLAPILAESGLNTIIAASDETNVATSVSGFKEYEKAGVLDLVGQWNTHTYSASIPNRAQIGSLAREAGKQLWMSEVGSGGSGISGNLSLMQKLMDDVRYIMPTAWFDWQYVEEGGDQWCTVRGNFSSQTYERVKSYYVHQHITKFIRVGYTFVTSLNEQTLAALSPDRDELVLVALNNASVPSRHCANIFFATPEKEGVQAYITTSKVNVGTFMDYQLHDSQLSFELAPQSIVTFVIPVSDVVVVPSTVQAGVPYLLLPQYNQEAALTVDAGGALKLGEISMDEAQTWTFSADGNKMTMSNAMGKKLNAGTSYKLTTSTTKASPVSILPVEDFFWRIMTDDTKGFDLNGENYTIGTDVGQYAYGTSVSAGHRNWQLLRLPQADNPTAIQDIAERADIDPQSGNVNIYDLYGRRLRKLPGRGVCIQSGKIRVIR